MRATATIERLRAAGCFSLLCAALPVGVMASWETVPPPPSPPSPITNLLQVRQSALSNPGGARCICLEGGVLWANPSGTQLGLHDGTAGILLSLGSAANTFEPGQRLRLTGIGAIDYSAGFFHLGVEALSLDADGLHPPLERGGCAFLKAGTVPICLQWFNGTGPFQLKVELEGPDLPRRAILPTDLSYPPPGGLNERPGVRFESFEGWWTSLPDFSQLAPVRTGFTEAFDLACRTRDEGVGLQFSGRLKVPREGLYQFYLSSDDGARLYVGETNLRVENLGSAPLPPPLALKVGQTLSPNEDGSWSQFEGRVSRIWRESDRVHIELSVGPASLEVQANDTTGWTRLIQPNSLVRATGLCLGACNPDGSRVPDRLMVSHSSQVEVLALPTEHGPLANTAGQRPLLTTVAEVHQLKREDARLGWPAKIRGVITSTDAAYHGFIIQDATRGIYIQGGDPVAVGDYVEVEGITDPGMFSPMLRATKLQRLGPGRLPAPLHPAWEQLINGSLDAQFVEIRGIVTSATPGIVRLLVPGGSVRVELRYGLDPAEMHLNENTLVRLRGGLIAIRNQQTHQVTLGEIQLLNPSAAIEQDPAGDAFSAPQKTASDLLVFDPQASLFQRVKMSGQVLAINRKAAFMMVGGAGIRFVATKAEELKPGDLVDVSGYPQLGGPSPILREALVRKTGEARLPAPQKLSPAELGRPEFDSVLVSTEGILTSTRHASAELLLELRQGAHTFAAHLPPPNTALASLPPGSRLEVAGVYVAQGSSLESEPSSGPFELLLTSQANVTVLARPPWWTLERLLFLLAALASFLVIAGLWITQLHRKVEQRTQELGEQIRRRQNTEQSRAMERERARIAQDLHDELGAGLTEIGMLAALPADDDSAQTLTRIGERSRHMVTSLDEIVWAMNPRHDSLESLGSYLCLYADRFLRLAGITCRLRGTPQLPNQPVNPIHRHELFLAFKEALANVVHHSRASEVRLSLKLIGGRLRLSLSDNGTGIISGPRHPLSDGLAGMRERLENMGGRFSVSSIPGRGTTLRFYLPLQ
jgi:signal transduction histidine kinase